MVRATVEYRPHGASEELFFNRDSEVLVEGPAGTGKTRGVLEYVYWLCLTFPGIRVLLMRKTRASLTESVLVTWENHVLPDRLALSGGASPGNRTNYHFPLASNVVNGHVYRGESHVVLGGIDKATRIMSTEYDVIVCFEAVEFLEDDWEMLLSRNRNFKMPWQQMIADTNPDRQNHWLNERAAELYTVPPELESFLPPARPGQTRMTRLLSRHKDNPMLWNRKKRRWTRKGAEYMRKLHALTGPRAPRLLRGEWVTSAGQIWEEFDREKHMVHRRSIDPKTGLVLLDGHPRKEDGTLRCDWYFASVDWGHRNPGVLQIWGVVGRFERMYRLHEVYRAGMQLDWWAEHVVRFDKKYKLQAVVCDPSRPENIATFNSRISDHRGRRVGNIAIKGLNEKDAGWDMVRFGFDPGASLRLKLGPEDQIPSEEPRLYLCWEAVDSIDTLLKEARQPISTEDEIPGYCYKEHVDGKPNKEESDPLAADHGCDAMRYAAMYAWGRDLSPNDDRPTYEPDTIGDILGHDDVFDEAA